MTAPRVLLSDSERARSRQARKSERHSARRLLIMRSARDLLAAHGIENFTVAEVARVSQLSKPAVYYYFDSKEALVFDLAVESLQIEFSVLAPAVRAAKTGVDCLVEVIRARVDFFLNDMNAFRILHVWTPALGLCQRLAQSNANTQISALLGAIADRLAAERTAGERAVHIEDQQLPQMAWALSQGILAQHAAGVLQPKDWQQCCRMRDAACRWLLDSLVI